MTTIIRRILFSVSAAVMFTACSDELFDISENSAEYKGIPFMVTTEEMGHEVVNMGSTRSGEANPGIPDEGDRFVERPLQGDNTFGLKVHKQPVPLMGFNSGAVKAAATGNSAGEPAISQAQGQGQVQGQTRAAANEVVATSGINFHDSLTIWGYTSNNTKLFDQILLTKVRNWRNSVEWPYNQGNYMRFYAVAPSLESINMSATGGSYATSPTLTYTLPEKPNELLDVLYGESSNISIASGPAGSVTTNPQQENLGKDNKFVELQFRHILTAVRFSQGTIPSIVTINSISISGSKVEGTYNPAETDDATVTQGKWTLGTATRTYTVSASHVGTGVAGATDVPIEGTPTLFLLPQTLPSDALLTVNLTEDLGGEQTKQHTLTCSLESDLWKKGYTVDYKITVGRMESGYYLSTSTDEINLEHSANAVSSKLGVNSYRLYYDYSSGAKVASYTPVTWDIQEVSADGSEYVPWINRTSKGLSWITDFRGVLNADTHYDGGNNATASFTVAGQTMALRTTHDNVLSGNPTTGDNQVDLSTTYPYANGGTHSKEPANCYIINRIGTYKFPLVYGNMTEDNLTQKDCFKDHQGSTITKYQIKNQIGANTNPGNSHSNGEYVWSRAGYSDKGIEGTLRATLLWQDTKDFISSVVLNESQGENAEGEIQFQIGKSVPANAVIALQARKVETYAAEEWTEKSVHTYGEWETLWTWHIWMTDEVYRNEGTSDENSYDAYFVNGSKSKNEAGKYVKGDHIATLQDYDTPSTTYDILPVNLGWVPDDDNFGLYEPRSVWIKLKQTDTDNTTEVKITQEARQELYTGTGTVYQWGRPTAFPAIHNLAGTVRTIYDIDNKNVTSKFVLAQSTNGGDAIANPYEVLQWETNPNSWFDVSSADYATANAMWSSTEKTVYDPCPPGFRVPKGDVFKVFSKTGATVTTGKAEDDETGKLNMWPDAQDLNGTTQTSGQRSKGGYFYCKKHTGDIPAADRYNVNKVDMVYMPATGEWHGNKAVGTQLQEKSEQLNQTNGLFWTSDYNNEDKDSKAAVLWVTPEWSFNAGTADKPVIGFFNANPKTNKLNYYTNLRPIRPRKN